MRYNNCAGVALIGVMLILGCTRQGAMKTGTTPAPSDHSQDDVLSSRSESGAPAFSDVPEAMDAPVDADIKSVSSKVRSVTVYSDRARVTRTARVDVETEPTVFAFRELPGWVDDGSVRVSVTAGRIVDVRVERNFLAKATDKSWQQAEEKHRALSRKLAGLNDELAVLDAQKVQIESIKAFSNEKITQDTTIGNVNVATYSDVLTFISDSLRATATARRDVQNQIDDLSPELEASARQLEDMKDLQQLEQTTVIVTLQGSQPASGVIEVTYMLPGATWEPMHELRVSTTDARAVEVISFAMVTQTSGEDWGKAEISFSTQSSVEALQIPELEALTLGDTQTTTQIVTSRMSSFSRAQKAFEGQNALWNKVNRSKVKKKSGYTAQQSYESNLEYLQVVQSKTVEMFETLQKRGTTAHFKAIAPPVITGDGHPVRTRIGHHTLQSTQKIVAVPEQTLNAARTLEMTNSTSQAFLPGKVALYQDGSFLGMTDISFIAPGETFALFLSVADHIKLSRKLDRKQSSLVQRKRTQMKIAYVVTAENLSGKDTAFTLADRIPIAENRDIKVSGVKISPAIKPDSKGLIFWQLNLKPGEKQSFRIEYTVEYPPTLILETRQKRMMQNSLPQSMDEKAIAPAPKSRMIEDQLLDLEEMF
ncbi:MAG: mucoidy inhibitor MuiA family protein [Deltaproteobacteria bacterium]|nr:mucoidy inhibitor MuiA family protein [Deltaproteobacteria bacterium]